MTTFYLKDMRDNDSTIEIDLSKLNLTEPNVTVDCDEVVTDMRLDFAVPAWHTLHIINCNNKQIYLGKNVHERTNIYICGKYNEIFCRYGDISINGDNNIISASHKSQIMVNSNNNEIICSMDSFAFINGDDNTIELCNASGANVSAISENNQIHLFDRARVENVSMSSSIIAEGRSVAYSVVEPIMLLHQAMCCKIYTGYVGEQICKEPLEDGKRGYFYKVVRQDMAPFCVDNASKYKVGEYYYPDKFDETTTPCSNGIHFFPDIVHAVRFASQRPDSSYLILKLIVEFDDFAPIEKTDGSNKYRARKVFVDSIVPEGEYTNIHKVFFR